MLDIGLQEMVTSKTIDKLATRIFHFLRSESFANNEWDDHGFDWAHYEFKLVTAPVCKTLEQRAARASFCPEGAVRMFLSSMSLNFRKAGSAIEVLSRDNQG